jgi:hypothetical protein
LVGKLFWSSINLVYHLVPLAAKNHMLNLFSFKLNKSYNAPLLGRGTLLFRDDASD